MPGPKCLCCQKAISTKGNRICPECGHTFTGNGWDGIDAHWRRQHADKLPYEAFWESLCDGHRGNGGGTVHYQQRYLHFITQHGVGRNDSIASSPNSYLSYLRSVSKVLRQDITPELLHSEDDIKRIGNLLEGKKAIATIRNYTSAMRLYVNMAKAIDNTPVLTDEVVNTWDEIIHHYDNGIPADKTGNFSITALRGRLTPIREGLQDEIKRQLPVFPRLANLKCYYADFWQAGRKGARLKGYIWNFLAPDKAKTRARLQTTFTIEHTIKAEYVAYPATDQGRNYDISKISRSLQNEETLKTFQGLLKSLPEGFTFICTTGNGKSISTFATDVTAAEWNAIRSSGINPNVYFIIGVDRARDELLNLTTSQLTTLLLTDLSELSGIRELFEGRNPEATKTSHTLAPEVERARRGSLPPTRRGFRPEFSGTKQYSAPKSTTQANCIHGKVVDALAAELNRIKVKYSNDGLRDLFIYRDDNTIQVLFEVKTALDTGSIYSAIGQLMLHGATEEKKPTLIAVLPGMPTEQTALAFRKLGIQCLTYELGDKIVFPDLNVLLAPPPPPEEGKQK